MAVLIKNGTIVTAEGESKADIYAEGESITAIGEGLQPCLLYTSPSPRDCS